MKWRLGMSPMNRRAWLGLILASAAAPFSAARAQAGGLVIFAAASLKNALDEIATGWAKDTGKPMPKISYAASSALAKQIEQGAPADLFISADLDWMDELAARHAIRANTRVNLLGNRLVLIGPAGAPKMLKIAPGFPLAAALGSSRLALADPTAVPAGKYAKAALTQLGVWDSVANRIASALRLVARGEAPLGIVYRTDAMADSSVVIIDIFPESTHAPIIYPIAVTASAPNAAAAEKVLAYLRSPAATAVFEQQGFTVPRRD
jgi:molybdate transport system substrate-binding protein